MEEEHHVVEPTEDDLVICKRLGEGASGHVLSAVVKATRQVVAVKIIDDRNATTRTKRRNRREVKVHSELDHRHICKLHFVIETETHHCLVMQYAHNGDLLTRLSRRGPLPPHEAKRVLRQLVSAVGHMHRKGFVHRDIKPENILLDHNNDVLLADFGFASKWSSNRYQRESCGSLHYAAPEVLYGELVRGPEADVWSCGAVFVAMLTASLPFGGLSDEPRTVLRQMEQKQFVRNTAMVDDPELLDLVNRMLEPDVTRRITLKQIRKHPCMKKESKVTRKAMQIL